MKSNNTIEINGRRYDAQTGQPLDGEKKTVKKAVQSAGKYIDGYRPQIARSVAKTQKAVVATKEKILPKANRTAPTKVSHKAARSTTLNRGTVRRPELSSKKASPKTPTTPSITTPANTTDSRLSRVAAITKSNAITRFHKSESASTPVHSGKIEPAQQATKAAKKNEASSNTKERLISQALSAANAHEQTKAKKHKKHHAHHVGRYLTTAAVALLIVAYVTYLNVPSISMKVAARRAGFAATMPSYKPSGYSLSGPIAYSAGQVVVGFKSNTDDRQFSFTQQPTNWDSTALVENYVTKQSPTYLTYQDSGLTIYIFNGSSAAWVNNGKLYSIDGKNSELDSDQLLKIATGA